MAAKHLVLKPFPAFTLLAVASLWLLASCDLLPAVPVNPPPPEKTKKQEEPEQSKYVTLALGGMGDAIGINTGNTVSVQRALSGNIAKMSYDFLEVVFKAGNIVARTSWELGEQVNLSGVYRTDSGINYSSTDPANNSAVMFVGRKSDKTLLAIGKLVRVDGVQTAVINSNSKSVTFEISVLKAGVRFSDEISLSSFQTYSTYSDLLLETPNTAIEDNIFVHYINNLNKTEKIYFPLFKLTPGATTYATYTFDFEGSTQWIDFPNAVRLALDTSLDKNGRVFVSRVPRYFVPGGSQYSSYLKYDSVTEVNMTNNNTLGGVFQNPVEFEFDGSGDVEDGSVFSLVFGVPVYALTSDAGGSGTAAVKWYIRPGYGSYNLDLDDGKGGQGGAVFIGTGDVYRFLVNGQ